MSKRYNVLLRARRDGLNSGSKPPFTAATVQLCALLVATLNA